MTSAADATMTQSERAVIGMEEEEQTEHLTMMTSAAAAAASPCDTASPYCQAMRNLLGETVTCTLDDGRTATGSLVCVDRLYVYVLYCIHGCECMMVFC
jgi:hypothetical protein